MDEGIYEDYNSGVRSMEEMFWEIKKESKEEKEEDDSGGSDSDPGDDDLNE
jgi:hypothetical protein